MKIKLYLIIFLFFQIQCIIGQEILEFEVKYLPNSDYLISTDQKMKYEMFMDANDGTGKIPEISEDSVKMNYSIHTTEKKDSIIPIKIVLLDSISAQLQKGTKFHGYAKGMAIRLDSIESTDMTELYKDILIKNMQSTFNQADFPKKTLKIGESFIHNSTMDLSTGFMPIKINTITTYKLEKVENQIAEFDVDKKYELNSQTEEMNIKIDGTGSGKIIYDSNEHFFTEYRLSFRMNMLMELMGMKVEGESSSDMIQNVIINTASR